MNVRSGKGIIPAVGRVPSRKLPGLKRSRKISIGSLYGKGLILLVPLNCLYWILSGERHGSEVYSFINMSAPIYFISVLAWLSGRVVNGIPETIWSPAFWLPVQSAVFYGVGPLVEVFGNEVTRDILSTRRLSMNAHELFRAHHLSVLGVTCLLFGFWLHMRIFSKGWKVLSVESEGNRGNIIAPGKLGVAFVLFGFVFKYIILNPAEWGMIDFVVPGVFSSLGIVLDVGFGVLTYAIGCGKKKYRWFFWIFWPIHLYLSWLSLSKLEIILPLLLTAAGAFLAHGKLWKLGVWFGAMILVFSASQPWVDYGRAEVYRKAGNIYEAGYAERMDMLRSYLVKKDRASVDIQKPQRWWTRLSYAGPQAFAMRNYDMGLSSSSLRSAWMFFVPRIVWPGKPIMIGPGLEFHRLVTGQKNAYSYMPLSIYGDLYWQFGWYGIALGCPLIGWMFAMMASRSISAIRHREFIMIPAVLSALQIALLGPNKFVFNGIVGPLPIYMAYLFAGQFALKTLRFSRLRQQTPREKGVAFSIEGKN